MFLAMLLELNLIWELLFLGFPEKGYLLSLVSMLAGIGLVIVILDYKLMEQGKTFSGK